MSQTWKNYPAIMELALEIAYDNGMISRFLTEEQWLVKVQPCLSADGVDKADLDMLEAFCLSLSDRDKLILAVGDFDDAEKIAARCEKPELVRLFDDIFNSG